MKGSQFPFMKLDRQSIFLILIIIAGLAAIWGIAVYGFFTLPNTIPTHFGLNGQPNAYGSGSALLLIAAVLSIAPIIIILTVVFRYTLITKYPYLINLPAFYYNINKIHYAKRGVWINKYFKVVLVVGVIVVLITLLIILGVYTSALADNFAHSILAGVIGLVAVLIIANVYMMYRINKAMRASLSRS